MTHRPSWYSWPFEVSPHAARRMPIRRFSETDLRGMLEEPIAITADVCPGRFIARCLWESERWDVILEPDEMTRSVIIVTAYSPDAP